MQGAVPGPIALLGSGETGPTGGTIFELMAKRVSAPPRVMILETPAGFQPNSPRVAGKVAEYITTRLHGLRPQVSILPARRRAGPDSTEAPAATAALLTADVIFLGPGSPTYTARQLRDTLAWRRMMGRQRRGASIVTASAATLAIGAHVLPVYEIYKVGAELHWLPGLDLFGPYGLSLAFIPHWNNAEGGADLDTSRCFMGQERYTALRAMLPPQTTVVGIDEHTALVIDPHAGLAEVYGRGVVTIQRGDEEDQVARGQTIALRELGPFHLPDLAADLPPDLWAELDAAAAASDADAQRLPAAPEPVLALVEERQAARARRDWAAADRLRQQLAGLGWQVQDTPEGPRLGRLEGHQSSSFSHL